MASWDVDQRDADALRDKRRLESREAPTWKDIGKNCKRFVKEPLKHAAALEDVRKRWRERRDWGGRRMWNDEADKAMTNVIKEVLAGYYVGMCPCCQLQICTPFHVVPHLDLHDWLWTGSIQRLVLMLGFRHCGLQCLAFTAPPPPI
jgi:hypothetical protein